MDESASSTICCWMYPATLRNKEKKERRVIKSRRGIACWGLGAIAMIENAPGTDAAFRGSKPLLGPMEGAGIERREMVAETKLNLSYRATF